MNENTDNKQWPPMVWPLMVLVLVGLIIILSVIQLPTSKPQKPGIELPPQNQNRNSIAPYSPAPAPIPPPPLPAPVATLPAPKPEVWELCWDKTPEATGYDRKVRSRCFEAKIDRQGDSLVIRQSYQHQGEYQTAIYTGTEISSGIYNGRWHQDQPGFGGEFFLRFSPDGNSAAGWVDNGTSRSIPLAIYKT